MTPSNIKSQIKPYHPKTSRGLGSVGRCFRRQERMRTDKEYSRKIRLSKLKSKLKKIKILIKDLESGVTKW